MGYVLAMRDHLPAGLKGLLVAAFLAAYMSTISTQLNWGASYLVNDFYKRFVDPRASERRLVRVSRASTLLVMVLSLAVTLILQTISGAWAFIIEAGAGLGLVLILRWYWWRINAWSEIAAMVTPLIAHGFIRYATGIEFPESLFFIVAATTVAWVGVTVLTKPVEQATLQEFFRRAHPGGVGWRRISRTVPEVAGDSCFGGLLLCWVAGIVLVYSMLFGIGKLILGEAGWGVIFLLIGCAAAWVIYRLLSRRGSQTQETSLRPTQH
jgi:Na+/proline symporter